MLHRFNSYKELENNICIPSIQRDLELERVDKIIFHLNERVSKSLPPIFGVISLCKLRQNNDFLYYVSDGQHRLEAYRREYVTKNKELPINAIIYEVETLEEVRENFCTINKCVEVPDYLLERTDYTELMREIEKFIKLIKGFDTSKSSRPYVNINKFMNELKDSFLITTLKTLDDFKVEFNNANLAIKNQTKERSFLKSNKISESMLEKCIKFDNYIGLDKNLTWLLEPMVDEEKEEEKRNRKVFSAKERFDFWHKYMGHEWAYKCPYCKVDYISIKNFDMAHVVSFKNGGNEEFENLRPTCHSCNLRIGSKNMDLNMWNHVIVID